MEEEKALAVFQGKNIRRTWHKEEWWFVIEDMIAALTDSVDPKGYVRDMRRRDEELSKGWGQIAHTLPVHTAGGLQSMNCVNTEGAFRIIQSIPSPKAEPFKLWLAKVGYERVQEIQDPELGQKRMKELYKQKGYSDEWIEKRARGIAVRNELTDEWRSRGVDEDKEFAILTNEISKATFGKTVEEYKGHKGLEKQNLRDHVDDLELIFTMLGEASTTRIAQVKDSQGFDENKETANQGGTVAGIAREELEKRTRRPVVRKENYLDEPEKEKRKRLS